MMAHLAPGQRTRRRGITVIELVITAATLALLVGGFSWLVGSGRSGPAPEATVREDAARILSAAEDWQQDHTAGCPSLSQLKHEGLLTRSARTDDPWGQRFRLECSSESFKVWSAGKDGVSGTSDDVAIPGPRS